MQQLKCSEQLLGRCLSGFWGVSTWLLDVLGDFQGTATQSVLSGYKGVATWLLDIISGCQVIVMKQLKWLVGHCRHFGWLPDV